MTKSLVFVKFYFRIYLNMCNCKQKLRGLHCTKSKSWKRDMLFLYKAAFKPHRWCTGFLQ